MSSKWSCSHCSFDNTGDLKSCEICGCPKLQDEGKEDPFIECPRADCGHHNSLSDEFCSKCHCKIFQGDSEPAPVPKEESKTCPNCSNKGSISASFCVDCGYNFNGPKKRKGRRPRVYGFGGAMMARGGCWGCGSTSPSGSSKLCADCEIRGRREEFCCGCYTQIDPTKAQLHHRECSQSMVFWSGESATYERCSKLQKDTMLFMHRSSRLRHFAATDKFMTRVKTLGYNRKDVENLQHYLANYAPIIIHMHVNTHFHYFVKDTHYRNQFETALSSGSMSLPSRVSWEDRMFDNLHHNAKPYERVKYGTMNFTNDPSGVRACVGYGQSYFLLKPHVRDRCTITDMDSSSPSATIATFRYIFHLLNRLSDLELKSAFEGAKGLEMASTVIGAYKQIQIHGPVEFARDVERVYVSKAELKLGQPELLMEQVKTFCLKHKIEYELIEGSSAVATTDKPLPDRFVAPQKELSEEDKKSLAPPPPPSVFGGLFMMPGPSLLPRPLLGAFPESDASKYID